MEKIKIIVEISKDLYGVYAENVDALWGSGKTLEEAKESLDTTIKLLKENNPKEQWPEAIKGEFELEYRWDVKSFLEHYKGILSQSGIGRIANIKPKMMQHYYSGEKTPSKKRVKEIEEALHELGRDLLAVEF